MVEISVLTLPHFTGSLPYYATDGAACMDVQAALAQPVWLIPGGRLLVPTGLAFDIPSGWEIQIRSRSGLALKAGIQVHPGTIDSDYKKEVKIILLNFGHAPVAIAPNDRIAQLAVRQAPKVRLRQVYALDDKGRGGFGHTGV